VFADPRQPPGLVCVVGSGGREHALALAIAKSADVVVCPGNAGMRALGIPCVSGPPESVEADLFVIGPEGPLVDGLADRLRAAGRLVFGPGALGARLEGSKVWMKEVLLAAGVPTALHAVCYEPESAREWLRSRPGPWVIKTDGLAGGKGVLVTDDLEVAEADVEAKLSGRAFGDAGRRVLLEEALSGPEVSLMVITDGRAIYPLAPAQDFKRLLEGDRGPNTGGMGALSPVPGMSEELIKLVMDRTVRPTVAQLRERGVDYRGVLYAGIMLTVEGPKVLEFNVRFGDPEAQVVLARWKGRVTEVLAAAAAGRLGEVAPPEFSDEAAVCVVLTSPGYPTDPRLGDPIKGLEESLIGDGVEVYSAGVERDPDTGELVTAGGRVLGVGATAPTLAQARRKAYHVVTRVTWEGVHYRRDIALAAARSG